MTSKSDDLIEKQIREHEAHLRRIDALFSKAREVHGEEEASDALLAALESERDTLAATLHRMRGDAPENWREVSERHFGPLAIWEALARVLEKSIEARESN